jgi:hypothetical protein
MFRCAMIWNEEKSVVAEGFACSAPEKNPASKKAATHAARVRQNEFLYCSFMVVGK